MMYITSDTNINKLPEKYHFIIVTADDDGNPDEFGMVFENRQAWDDKLAELREDKKQFMSFER